MKKFTLMLTMALLAIVTYAIDATWTAVNQGYENSQAVTEVTLAEGVTAVFDKADGTTAPSYYDTGEAVRLYAGNTLTITSTEALTKISFVFDTNNGKKMPAFNVSVGEVNIDGEAGVWTGNATEVVFTVPNVSGQQSRIKQIVIGEGGEEIIPDPAEDDQVVVLPEGAEVQTWYLSGKDSEDQRLNEEMGVAFVGNDIYLQGLCYYLPDAWVKGTLNGTTATFAKGQYYGTYEYSGKKYPMYFAGYDFDTEGLGDVTFTYDAEAGTLTTEDYIMINGNAATVSYYDYYYDVVISSAEPEQLQPVEVPEGLVTGEYALTATKIVEAGDEEEYEYESRAAEEGDPEYEEQPYNANIIIGFDGNDVYFQGLCSDLPYAWAKGTLSGDGKTITIPANQYLGCYDLSWLGMGSMEYYITAADSETGDLIDVVFSYDAEAGQLTSNQEIFINGDENELYYYEWFTNMSMTKLNEVAATPATPVIGSFKYTEGSTMSFGRLSYEIPTVGTNGEALLTSKLSYQIMIDKDGQVQPLKLTTDLYEALTEDMEIIPYNFSDDYDIYNYVIYLNQPKDEIFSWKKVGVKSIYSAAGETHESQIAWFDLENYVTGINATAADKGDVRFFDLQGRAANGSAKGMLLKQTRLADGNVKTVKVIRK